jgi:hypothetical protein
VVTGESSLYDEWGDRRDDFALADLLGVHLAGERLGGGDAVGSWETYDNHSYLRIEEREIVDGLGDTELLPFGGQLQAVRTDGRVALTLVPPFPIYPPEKSWMAEPRTAVPAVVLGSRRVAYLAADLDRLYARYHHPDHGRLLANLVRWSARGDIPLSVEGAGVLDCHLYRQGEAVILHLVNLDQGGAWQGRLEEFTPAGPFTVRLRAAGSRAVFLVSGGEVEVSGQDDWITVEVARITDHEVVVIR